jgi:alpha-D-ribose 1-methylphosphonate 5-triphosphate synthase subunit PhnG
MKDTSNPENARKSWMSLLAKAPEGQVARHLNATTERPEFTWLRTPEIGSVMVRGRAGGTGAPFNLGEMTVTRCALQLSSGEVGHAYVQGRRKACAEAAAIVDALMQTDSADRIRLGVLTPLATAAAGSRERRAQKAAATKVDFFTMARGED